MQAVLEDCLENGDEAKFLKCMEEIRWEIPLCVANDLLTLSALCNLQQAVKAILKRFKEYVNVRVAARIAVQNAHHGILGQLLEVKPEVAHHLILSVCLKLAETRERRVNDMLRRSNLKTCLEYILKYIDMNVNVIDIADISSVLSAYFDDCWRKIRNQTNENIENVYRCLMSPNIFSTQNTTHQRTCETEVFLDIARNKNLSHLLKHPLLSFFLYRKWYRIRRIFYMNIAFYGIFYFLLNTYILNMTYESSRNKNGTQTVNDSIDVVLNTHTTHTHSTFFNRFYPESLLWVFVIVLWLLFTVREILLFACYPRRYLMMWENWLHIALILFTPILLCSVGVWCRDVVMILSALVMINLFKQHPKMSFNCEIFWAVSHVCACSLLPCLFFMIGPFGLTFHTFFKKRFSNIGNIFLKTLIMLFTGEFNFNDISVDLLDLVLSYIVFVLFTFLIIVYFFTIVLVVRYNETLSVAKLNGLISQIRLIVYLEKVAFGEPFSWINWFRRGNLCLLQWKPFSFLINRIFLFAHYKDGVIIFFHDCNPDYIRYIRD